MKTLILKIILMLPLPLESQHVESFLQSHGIKARVEIVNLAQPLTLGSQLQHFAALRSAFSRKRGEHIHVLTEPFMQDDQEYMLGFAVSSEKISMSVWNSENSFGEQRELHSWAILAHEIGHQLSLNHTIGCNNLMAADLGRCPNIEKLSFTQTQINQMNNFLRHRK
jgi:hypothetical protein